MLAFAVAASWDELTHLLELFALLAVYSPAGSVFTKEISGTIWFKESGAAGTNKNAALLNLAIEATE